MLVTADNYSSRSKSKWLFDLGSFCDRERLGLNLGLCVLPEVEHKHSDFFDMTMLLLLLVTVSETKRWQPKFNFPDQEVFLLPFNKKYLFLAG